MNEIKFRLDTREFTATLRRYAEMSRRALPDIVNKKAFYIARRATVLTPKADKSAIRSQLGSVSTNKKTGERKLKLAMSNRRGVSLAEAIIRARLSRKGEPQPAKSVIGEAIAKMIAARMKSVAFLKSGWLPAIRTLGALVGASGPRVDRSAAQVGAPKGSAAPARPGFRVACKITNSASTRRDKKDALIRYGGLALQQAFAFEAASMKQWIEDRLRGDARKSGIKTR